MSVYKSAKSPFFQYDFQFKKRRFHGSTGVKTRRQAEQCEAKIRARVALGEDLDAEDMTLDQAALRWWEEHGSRLRTSVDLERRLATLLRIVGADTPLRAIGTKQVRAAVQKRLNETFAKAADKPGRPAKRYPIAPATVNADIISPLRRILNTAARAWEVRGLSPIDWEAVRCSEPDPELREYTAEQQDKWIAECGPVARSALRLLLTYGLRFGELFFPLDAFDGDGPRLILNRRKNKPYAVPLLSEDGAWIAERVARARGAGLDTIWFDEIRAGAEQKLSVVSYYGLQARLRSAGKRAGLKMKRLIHGARHHAGTTVVRSSGNLKIAQQLLGHSDITSTMRYVHALEADVRQALERRRDRVGVS